MKNITKIIKSENGSVLGMVLIFFLVMTIIGVAFLTMASQEASLFEKQLDKTKAFRIAESGINIALWRINSGPDLYGSFSNDSLSVTYDSTAMILSSTGISGSHQQTISVNLFIDSPFNHIISYTNTLIEQSYSLNNTPGHEEETFDELPVIDLSHYIYIADNIYYSDTTFKNTTLNGINFIFGNVTIKNDVKVYGTVVATGSIKFIAQVEIYAQQMPDTTTYYPALVAADTAHAVDSEIYGAPNVTIKGAIYCNGSVGIKGGEITGPIVAKDITLSNNAVITDEGSEKYYLYPPGFGNEDYNKYIVSGSWSYND
ncbi:MAG: pilus assembly PilX N-terminal domain-containing protein [Candidatus Marinimicrobia bacterium]|nr:pilus assembly PilX N-terminal domain-containing protein [Candidatus Neomarinimicrobiota bacterium]